MPSYRYRAMDLQGKSLRSRMEARSVDDLEARLSEMELDLISWHRESDRAARISRRSLSSQDMIMFCFHLEQVLTHGVPLLDGLEDLRDSATNHTMRTLAGALLVDIQSGKTLAGAMEAFPQVFDHVFISLVRAGESTGKLGAIFHSLTEDMKWQDELQAKTKKLIMYPMFVGGIVTALFFFMMIFLVPQMVTLIKMMDIELPFHTRLLIDTSDFVLTYWYILLGTPIGLYVGIKALLKVSPMAQTARDWFKIRMPMFGPIIFKIMLSRFASVFSLMYGSGIPILQCLEVSEGVVGNRVMARTLQQVGKEISEGATITDSFREAKLFPPLVLRMVQVGETTGALQEGLNNVRYFYDREVKESVEKLQGMIEPMLTLIMGLLMAWIIVSVFGPVYEIMNKVKF
uniref:Putative Type II secretory pathway protein, component PulF n=1 Tax=Magnetococcus massalia (strain MO-1) TaxID=451514 RepID=A0A1S7LJR6_MAGMO|nr:putative Type II secretory pathway protein, component PulF [Candidatus Magnetococcus massalia]